MRGLDGMSVQEMKLIKEGKFVRSTTPGDTLIMVATDRINALM